MTDSDSTSNQDGEGLEELPGVSVEEEPEAELERLRIELPSLKATLRVELWTLLAIGLPALGLITYAAVELIGAWGRPDADLVLMVFIGLVLIGLALGILVFRRRSVLTLRVGQNRLVPTSWGFIGDGEVEIRGQNVIRFELIRRVDTLFPFANGHIVVETPQDRLVIGEHLTDDDLEHLWSELCTRTGWEKLTYPRRTLVVGSAGVGLVCATGAFALFDGMEILGIVPRILGIMGCLTFGAVVATVLFEMLRHNRPRMRNSHDTDHSTRPDGGTAAGT